MRIILEEEDYKHLEKRVLLDIEKNLKNRLEVRELISSILSEKIAGDISLRKEVHRKVVKLKQDEIDMLNSQLDGAMLVLKDGGKLK